MDGERKIGETPRGPTRGRSGASPAPNEEVRNGDPEVSRHVVPEDDLTVFTATGRLTPRLFLTASAEYLQENPTRLVLWDLTEANLAGIYEADIDLILEELTPHGETRRGGKTAYVFSRTVDFGVGRIAEVLAASHGVPYQIQSFWSMESAEEWLFSEEDVWFDKNLLALVSPDVWLRRL